MVPFTSQYSGTVAVATFISAEVIVMGLLKVLSVKARFLMSVQFMTGVTQNPSPIPTANIPKATVKIPTNFFEEFIAHLLNHAKFCAIAPLTLSYRSFGRRPGEIIS